jgi:hypothetical protein
VVQVHKKFYDLYKNKCEMDLEVKTPKKDGTAVKETFKP